MSDKAVVDGALKKPAKIQALKNLIRTMESRSPPPRATGRPPMSGRAFGGFQDGVSGPSDVRVEDGLAHSARTEGLGTRLLRHETPFGPVCMARQVLEPDHVHGTVPLWEARHINPDILRQWMKKDRGDAGAPQRILFLDTETTGLSRGAGTIPFLIGYAWFEDASLVVEQVLLEDVQDEVAMLERLRARLQKSDLLVTYNGKCFDSPILASRFVLNRLGACPPLAHLDLLHYVRRLYRRRLGSARLTHVEDALLGVRRDDDVPGYEIPLMYWSYLDAKDVSQLAPVVEHNRIDIVSLVALFGRVIHRFDSIQVEEAPEDHLCFGKLAFSQGDYARAYTFFSAAVQGERRVSMEAHRFLARLHVKNRAFEAARAELHHALECAERAWIRRELHLALAKLYEHRFKRFDTAFHHARCALGAESEEAHARRLVRLKKRQERAKALRPAPPPIAPHQDPKGDHARQGDH